MSKYSQATLEKKPGKKPKIPKMRYFYLGFPCTTRKRKERNGKTRVMATLYITENTSMPMFWFYETRTLAKSLTEALRKFKAKFPKSKGWSIGKVRRLRDGKSAHLNVSFVRDRKKGE